MPGDAFGEPFDPVLDAARTGESWAFQRLYDWLAAPVAGYVRGAGVEDPDGLVNDCFLRVFGGVERFEGTEVRFRSWVFAIAHNLVIDDRRRRARRPKQAPLVGEPGELIKRTAFGDLELKCTPFQRSRNIFPEEFG